MVDIIQSLLDAAHISRRLRDGHIEAFRSHTRAAATMRDGADKRTEETVAHEFWLRGAHEQQLLNQHVGEIRRIRGERQRT